VEGDLEGMMEEGKELGSDVGGFDIVGFTLGITEGFWVLVGKCDGKMVGILVGFNVGSRLMVGPSEGESLGLLLGSSGAKPRP